MSKISVNAVYITYQGEVNHFGIGAPVVFLRLQGCPIRCYLDTLGTLCDTPEALERTEGTVEIADVVKNLIAIKDKTGVDLICLSGGDPLWQNKETLHELFTLLEQNNFKVSVETSGVLPITHYLAYKNIYWVIDYKLQSAGVHMKFHKGNYDNPDNTIIKFVVYDEFDLDQAIQVYRSERFSTNNKFTMGLYWGTDRITYEALTARLIKEDLLGKISVNFQTHKLAEFYDQNSVTACNTTVRTKI